MDKFKGLKISPAKLAMPILLLVFVIVWFRANYAGVDSTEAGKSAGAGYETIHYVDGVAFSVLQDAMSKATAISSVSEGMDIDKEMFYMYKNDGTQFMLFCVNSVVIAAQKGTRFDFANAEDKIAALGNSSIMNIWFEKSYKKADVEELNETMYAVPVNAGVVYTNEVYDDYCGELVTLSDGTEEWAIFAGVPGERYDKLDNSTRKAIENITRSIHLEAAVAETEDTYAITLSGTSTEEEKVETVKQETTEKKPTPTPDASVKTTPTPTPTPTSAAEETPSGQESSSDTSDTEQSKKTDDSSEDEVEIVEEPVEEKPSEDTENKEEEPNETEPTETESSPTPIPTETPGTNSGGEDSENPSPTPEPSPTPDPGGAVVTISDEIEGLEKDKKESNLIERSSLDLNNQKKIVEKSSDKAYSSSIFQLLNIGDSGVITELDVNTGQYEKPIINIEKLYVDQEAETIIKNYCNSGSSRYVYFDPPVASSWHVIKYKLNYSKCASMPYINIKLKGLDGRNLRFRGVEYTPRTRDIAYKARKEGDWYVDILCYYEVPNGCREYVLECGSGTIENRNSTELRSAYYYIKVPETSTQKVQNIVKNGDVDMDAIQKAVTQQQLDKQREEAGDALETEVIDLTKSPDKTKK